MNYRARMAVLHDDVPWPMTTERLLLRAGTAADAAAVWAHRRLPEVARWQTTWHRDRAEFVAGFTDPSRLGATVVVESAGAVIGDLMVRIEDGWGQTEVADAARSTQAELGWTFGSDHQGRGLATEAVGRMIEACFDDLGLRRLTAECFAGNEASRRLMERLGMRREGWAWADALHRDGGWLDSYRYALLREERRGR